jgi:hypothetical protein
LDSYARSKIDEIKGQMRASAVHYDLAGITLTIDGGPLFLPFEEVRAMSYLLSTVETEAVDQLRQKMLAERGPY